MTRAMADACWFCDDDRTDPPPGGWLLADETWRAGAAPASYGVPGTVILEARRPAGATTRGPRYLVDAVVHVEPDETATQEAVDRLRAALTRAAETP